jgi:hypothetical protein
MMDTHNKIDDLYLSNLSQSKIRDLIKSTLSNVYGDGMWPNEALLKRRIFYSNPYCIDDNTCRTG